MRRLGKKSKNASKCTKRWSDHKVEQLIDLLEENSGCPWGVSNKDYYLRKNNEGAYKQIEEKRGTERAVILKGQNNNLTPTILAVVCMHHATIANKCQQLPTLLGPAML